LEIYFSLSPNACLTFRKAYSETPKHVYFTYQPGLRPLHFMKFGSVTDGMWAGLTSVSDILSVNYVAAVSSNGIMLIADFMNICQGDTVSYGENHGAWLYRKSTRFPF